MPAFEASKHMVSNGEYLEFVKDAGYARQELWSDVGWRWKMFGNVKKPQFWVPEVRQAGGAVGCSFAVVGGGLSCVVWCWRCPRKCQPVPCTMMFCHTLGFFKLSRTNTLATGTPKSRVPALPTRTHNVQPFPGGKSSPAHATHDAAASFVAAVPGK